MTTEPFTRAAVVAEALSLVGTPYIDQACLKGVGMDCGGVVRWIAKYFHRPESEAFERDIRFKGYSRGANPVLFFAACDDYLDRISIEEVLPGDIALARVEVDPQHCAIVTSIDPLYVVHAYTQARRVVENRVDDYWRSLVVRLYRFRGIE